MILLAWMYAFAVDHRADVDRMLYNSFTAVIIYNEQVLINTTNPSTRLY